MDLDQSLSYATHHLRLPRLLVFHSSPLPKAANYSLTSSAAHPPYVSCQVLPASASRSPKEARQNLCTPFPITSAAHVTSPWILLPNKMHPTRSDSRCRWTFQLGTFLIYWSEKVRSTLRTFSPKWASLPASCLIALERAGAAKAGAAMADASHLHLS